MEIGYADTDVIGMLKWCRRSAMQLNLLYLEFLHPARFLFRRIVIGRTFLYIICIHFAWIQVPNVARNI